MATVTIEWKTQIWIVWLSEWMVNLKEITFSESSQEVSKMELQMQITWRTMGRWTLSVLVTMVMLAPVHLSAMQMACVSHSDQYIRPPNTEMENGWRRQSNELKMVLQRKLSSFEIFKQYTQASIKTNLSPLKSCMLDSSLG